LLVTSIADQARHQPYLQRGAELMVLPEDAGHANLPMLMQRLAERGVNELMIEAGAGLNGALVRAGLVDEAILYLAPSLVGSTAQGLFAWPALEDLADKQQVKIQDVRMVGADIRISMTLPCRELVSGVQQAAIRLAELLFMFHNETGLRLRSAGWRATSAMADIASKSQ
jgi:diaminohydroxyphosphoribosylaminopyrimidine deaminase/5-amino-6-(5-phosphoribosylamino)uracil reductase